MVPPCSIRMSRVPTYSSAWNMCVISNTGLSPSVARVSKRFFYNRHIYHAWAVPRSLAATCRISVDFFSSGYLDVSVLRVRSINLCIQLTVTLKEPGFPIRISPGQSVFIHSPKLFADYYVLHRLLLPRHPPFALNYLVIYNQTFARLSRDLSLT